MKVFMKEFERWCGEYTKRWNKKDTWGEYLMAKDAYINGFKKAREQAYATTGDSRLLELGNTKVEVEVKSHQIGQE